MLPLEPGSRTFMEALASKSFDFQSIDPMVSVGVSVLSRTGIGL